MLCVYTEGIKKYEKKGRLSDGASFFVACPHEEKNGCASISIMEQQKKMKLSIKN